MNLKDLCEEIAIEVELLESVIKEISLLRNDLTEREPTVREKTAAGVAQILALAALPGRKVLEAQLVSQLSSPVYRLVYALSGQPQRLVSVLNQIKNLSEAKSPVAFSEGGTKGGVS